MSSEALEGIEEEMADVLLYLIRLADRLNINLATAAQTSLKRNAEKYPIDLKPCGNAVKYSRRSNDCPSSLPTLLGRYARKNLQTTILNPVQLSEVEDLLEPEFMS